MQAPERHVVVIGAGVAGLAAAWELRRLGLAVAVCESEAQSGGRARSALHRGHTLEVLPPVLWAADHGLLAWIAEVGASDELLPLRPLIVAHARGRQVREVEPRALWDFARLPGVRTHHGLRLVRLPRLMRRYGARLDPEHPESGAPLDDRSLADFGNLYFGRSVVESWMGPCVTSGSLGDERETSRVHFLRHYRRLQGSRPGLPRGPLAEALTRASTRLSTVLGARVTSVGQSGERCRVGYERDGRNQAVECDAVVIACAAPEAARLAADALTEGERKILTGVHYAPAVTVAAGACRVPAAHPTQIRVPHAEGLPLESALLEPGCRGGRIPDGRGGVTLQATGRYAREARELPDDTVAKDLLEALARFHPSARSAIDFQRVLRLERALPRFDVGHYRAIARLTAVETERRAEGRRLYLAGDYRLDPSWSGAFESGVRAARALAGDLAARK